MIRHALFLQECEVVYASVVYNSISLVFNTPVPFVITELLKPSGEWELLNAPVFHRESTHTSTDWEEFSHVGFKLVLRRIPNYFVISIIIPLVCMLLLTNVAFIMPAHSGEKISFQMGILVMFSVFWMLTAEITPRGGNSMPALSKELHHEIFLIYADFRYTIKPVYNDHLMGYFSASSRWPLAT